MSHALTIYLIGCAFSAGATGFYDTNRWLCRAIWFVGGVVAFVYAKIVGLA